MLVPILFGIIYSMYNIRIINTMNFSESFKTAWHNRVEELNGQSMYIRIRRLPHIIP